MFNRLVYKQLLEWRNSKLRKPLLVRGVRQCGKTFLIKAFAEKEYSNYHYINFELRPDLIEIFEQNLVPKRLISMLEQVLQIKINLEHDLIIFDEIQDCPKALTSLKYFEEQLQQVNIVAAGSLIGVRLNETSFPVGKVSFLDLAPLSFVEFLGALNQDSLFNTFFELELNDDIPTALHLDFWQYYLYYLFTGGLPEVVGEFVDNYATDLNLAFNKTREKQYELIRSYVSDIAKHSGKQNALHIERVWRSIPAQLAREIDETAKRFRFKEVISGRGFATFSGPIDWLVAADLCIKNFIVETPSIPLGAYVKENIFKLFSFDIGMLGALANITSQNILDQQFGTYKGYYAENFVLQELKASQETSFYSWTSGKTAEIEFLLNSKNEIIPVEVKSGRQTNSKSLTVYQDRHNPKMSVIISAKQKLSKKEGKVNMPLYLAFRLKKLLEEI